MAATKRYTTTIVKDGAMCFIPVPFDPEPVFGKIRAPVRVTVNGYTYRSTIAAMGVTCIPLRKSNREAAGLVGTETLEVTLVADEEARVVEAPADLIKALKARAGALVAWKALSYSHQREHVEAIADAKRPETRARRIAAAVAKVMTERSRG